MRQIAGGQLVTRENGPVTDSFAALDHLLDVKEAAALLNVPESWIYQHVRARAGDQLPHIKLGKYIRFSAQGLMQWLETRQLGGDNTNIRRPTRLFSEAEVTTISHPRDGD